MIYQIYPDKPNENLLQECADRLRKGDIAIIPTDSVYAVAGDFQAPGALEKLAKIKGEAVKQSEFSFIFTDLSQLSDFTLPLSGPSFKTVKKLLPGPYTIVLEANNNLGKTLGQKRKTIGVRIPNHPITLKLSELLGRPLATTSLHHDDDLLQYPTDPEEIVAKYSHLADFTIDGGWGDNIPSTVVDLTSGAPEVIREGKGDVSVI